MKESDTSTTPASEGTKRAYTLRDLCALLALLVLLVCIPLIWNALSDTPASAPAVVDLVSLDEAMQQGNYESAIASLQAIQADANASADEKARAVIYTLGAARALGDTSAVANDVRTLKATIAANNVAPAVKSELIDKLVGQLSISGNDPAIYDLVFADAPFAAYRVAGDDRRSLMNLSLWSLEISPSPVAAISLARWHSQPSVPWAGGSEAVSEESARDAVTYLALADELADAASANDASYAARGNYYFYLFWRAVVVGRLAEILGEPYESQVRAKFDEFIALAEERPALRAREWLSFARYWYAVSLVREAETEAAREQLDRLSEEIAIVPKKETNSFILNIRDQYERKGEGWETITAFAAISPAFKSTIEGIIGASLE